VIARPKTDESLVWIESSLGHAFRDPALARAALTHRSAGGGHNERLEFLGDSVLNCCVARLLFDAHPDADEGALSRLRATLVSGETLAAVAAGIELGERLKLGPGELRSGGPRRASILADALEAMIGAVYLDGGFEAASQVVKKLLGRRLEELPSAERLKDPKTLLQEILQANGIALPVYSLTAVLGDAHQQSFEVTCEVNALNLLTAGEGSSRRRAEQHAARRLLDRLPVGTLRVARSNVRPDARPERPDAREEVEPHG
jgi:ribonuclease-3